MPNLKVTNSKTFHQILFILSLMISWELLARIGQLPALLFPPVSSILHELWAQTINGELIHRTGFSLYLIGVGLGLAIILALLLTILAACVPLISEWVQVLMAVLHPLPGIAILPIVILWLGTGPQSIIAVIVMSAVWPLVANLLTGIKTIPITQIEVGKNLGLTGLRLVWSILLPGAFPHILSGLRVGWARAWQAAVAAEMVFGASGGEGGLGWFIYKERFFMEITAVFAGMIVIVLIGLIVERLLFEVIELKTVRRWGMTTN
ncbi:MAG TPA: ABC transporter permease [Firmicutes bacterium]|jgi:NitT/TauT family transport system permease protein|nr:ABC transporter permease [Bacillota bacterium]